MVALCFEYRYSFRDLDLAVNTYKCKDLQIYVEYTDECVHVYFI